MTGEEHYKKAERLLSGAREHSLSTPGLDQTLAGAQVHATLALAAFTKQASDRTYDPDRYAVGPR